MNIMINSVFSFSISFFFFFFDFKQSQISVFQGKKINQRIRYYFTYFFSIQINPINVVSYIKLLLTFLYSRLHTATGLTSS